LYEILVKILFLPQWLPRVSRLFWFTEANLSRQAFNADVGTH
jgi:hypothetical protein